MRSLLPLLLLSATSLAFCPDGWIENKDLGWCYYFNPKPTTFGEAERWCDLWGDGGYGGPGHLTSIHSTFENNFIAGITNTSYSWIGAQRLLGFWEWTDGTEMEYSRWQQKPVVDLSLPCGIMNHTAKEWNNIPCDHKHAFVCRRAILPDPTPPLASRCPFGYKYFDKTHSCYLNVENNLNGDDFFSWAAAEAYCEQYTGGHIVSIHSEEEEVFVRDMNTAVNRWIGLIKTNGTDPYLWIDGTPLDYTKWADGWPREHQGECVIMLLEQDDTTKWFNYDCTSEIEFDIICKIPALV